MRAHREDYLDYIQDPWSSTQGDKHACVHGWVDPWVRDEVFTGISQVCLKRQNLLDRTEQMVDRRSVICSLGRTGGQTDRRVGLLNFGRVV